MTCAEDVLETFDLVPVQAQLADLGDSARAVLGGLGDSALTADEIARAAGFEFHLAAPLIELELGGRSTLADGVYRAAI
jgi:DprA/Smf-like nucleotide binding protein involved in DNA uptake